MEDFAKALEFNQKLAIFWKCYGDSKFCLDDIDGAIKIYEEAISHNIEDEGLYNNLGVAYLTLGDTEKSLTALKRWLFIYVIIFNCNLFRASALCIELNSEEKSKLAIDKNIAIVMKFENLNERKHFELPKIIADTVMKRVRGKINEIIAGRLEKMGILVKLKNKP